MLLNDVIDNHLRQCGWHRFICVLSVCVGKANSKEETEKGFPTRHRETRDNTSGMRVHNGMAKTNAKTEDTEKTKTKMAKANTQDQETETQTQRPRPRIQCNQEFSVGVKTEQAPGFLPDLPCPWRLLFGRALWEWAPALTTQPKRFQDNTKDAVERRKEKSYRGRRRRRHFTYSLIGRYSKLEECSKRGGGERPKDWDKRLRHEQARQGQGQEKYKGQEKDKGRVRVRERAKVRARARVRLRVIFCLRLEHKKKTEAKTRQWQYNDKTITRHQTSTRTFTWASTRTTTRNLTRLEGPKMAFLLRSVLPRACQGSSGLAAIAGQSLVLFLS